MVQYIIIEIGYRLIYSILYSEWDLANSVGSSTCYGQSYQYKAQKLA